MKSLLDGDRFLFGELNVCTDMDRIRDLALKWRGVLHLVQAWTDGTEGGPPDHMVAPLAEMQDQVVDVVVVLENALGAFQDIDEALEALANVQRAGGDPDADPEEPDDPGEWPADGDPPAPDEADGEIPH